MKVLIILTLFICLGKEELLRKKNKLPFDYYKEILGNYRKIIYELDVSAVQNMIMMMPKTRMIMEALELEVF